MLNNFSDKRMKYPILSALNCRKIRQSNAKLSLFLSRYQKD